MITDHKPLSPKTGLPASAACCYQPTNDTDANSLSHLPMHSQVDREHNSSATLFKCLDATH